MTDTAASAASPHPVRQSAGGFADERTRTHLELAELTVRGQIPDASNAVLLCEAEYEGRVLPCVYKPVAGERPLWDFPDGTLAQREVAAFELSRATGWGIVPATVLRDGPYGEGMVQAWIGEVPRAAENAADGPDDAEEPDNGSPAEQFLALVDGEEPGDGWKAVGFVDVGGGRTALLVHADDPRLRRLSVLDAVINNGDRKGGHLLLTDGRLYGIDHGVTFHAEDKLRTLLWGWAGEELTVEATEMLSGLCAALEEGSWLTARLEALLTGAEIEALRKRTEKLRSSGRHPLPGGDWPAIPWPPV
jgi:uncharacterized repeat protein (TIGR03843 family)